MLGKRETAIYGQHTLETIVTQAAARATAHQLTLEAFQTNHEGELLDRVHAVYEDGVRGVIINPAGWSHTSVSLRDALAMLEVPLVEVHLTNTHRREQFRQFSFVSTIATGVIQGFGAIGYLYAVDALANMLRQHA